MISGIIKYHRQKSGLSRNELAKLAGVGKTVIYDIENGKDTLRFSTISKILAVLNIELKFNSPLMNEYLSQIKSDNDNM